MKQNAIKGPGYSVQIKVERTDNTLKIFKLQIWEYKVDNSTKIDNFVRLWKT